jgi:hypothetical protein
MSALSSGFEGAELFYRVVSPAPGDLRDPYVGACYRQKADICWLPDRGTTIWVVTNVKTSIGKEDIITLQPNAGESNRPRWQRPSRRVLGSILRTEYKPCAQQRQYPPC